MMILTDSSQSG